MPLRFRDALNGQALTVGVLLGHQEEVGAGILNGDRLLRKATDQADVAVEIDRAVAATVRPMAR